MTFLNRSRMISAALVTMVATAMSLVGPVPTAGQSRETAKPDYDKIALAPSLRLPSESDPEYRTRKRDVENEINALKSRAKKVLKGELDFGPNRDSLDRFFGEYFLPRMTHYDDLSISNGNERNRHLRVYLAQATDERARDYFLDSILLPFAKKVCEGNYHPAARVNAMTMIANLNRRDGIRRIRLPTLMSESLSYMVQTMEDENRPLFLKVAALQGIARHVSIDQLQDTQIPDNLRANIRDRMLKIVQRPYPGKKNADDFLYFQQRVATQILGNLHDPGAGNVVAAQLRKMIADKDLRLWLRNDAIESFGKLQFRAQDKPTRALIRDTIQDAVQLVSATAGLQAEKIDAELTRLKEDYLVFTGKDLADAGNEKRTDGELREMNIGAESGEAPQKQKNDQQPKSFAELPSYRLNRYRREFKTLAETVAVAINGPDAKTRGGLTKQLDKPDAEKAHELATQVRLQMSKIDRDLFSRRSQKKMSRTDQLRINLQEIADEFGPDLPLPAEVKKPLKNDDR